MKPPLPGALPCPLWGGRMCLCLCSVGNRIPGAPASRHDLGNTFLSGACLWMKRNYTPSGIELSTGIIDMTGQTA